MDAARLASEELGYRDSLGRNGNHRWPSNSKERLLFEEVINDLLRAGVLSTAFMTEQGEHWRFVRLTDYGSEVLGATGPCPYDPDGYVRDLRASVGDLDELVVEYLGEALLALRQGCLRSVIVMVGIAAERLAVMLAERLSGCTDRSVTAAVSARGPGLRQDVLPAMTRLDQIAAVLEALNEDACVKLPPDVKEGKRDVLKLLDNVRSGRNDSGHPTGLTVTMITAFYALAVFPAICKHVYDIMAWLKGLDGGDCEPNP